VYQLIKKALFLGGKKTLLEFDIFYLTFDEPEKEARWNEIKEMIPTCQRIDGVKGFDLAHKRCAELSKTERFVVIDGDNVLLPSFFSFNVSKDLIESSYVLSWSSSNSINGLKYGNGGVKCWPREIALNMKSHESSNSDEGEVDFCFIVDYYQFSESLSKTIINLTPYQSFRAGYREGVKMSLDKGVPLRVNQKFMEVIKGNNLKRLRAWCEIGRDVENGIWAMYGARLGCLELAGGDVTLRDVRDYEWFEHKWENTIKPLFHGSDHRCLISGYSWSEERIEEEIKILKNKLKNFLNLDIQKYDKGDSINFKKEFENPKRQGLMFPKGIS